MGAESALRLMLIHLTLSSYRMWSSWKISFSSTVVTTLKIIPRRLENGKGNNLPIQKSIWEKYFICFDSMLSGVDRKLWPALISSSVPKLSIGEAYLVQTNRLPE